MMSTHRRPPPRRQGRDQEPVFHLLTRWPSVAVLADGLRAGASSSPWFRAAAAWAVLMMC